MQENRKALIIGAGIGGIATSLFLSQNGYEVDVYEKNSTAGGRCGMATKDGYRFDLGATMMLMPEVYRDVLSSLGISMDEEMGIKKLEDIYTVYFDDNTSLAFTRDRSRMRDQLEKLEKGSSKSEQRYVDRGYRMYRIAFDNLIGRNFLRFFDFFRLKNVVLLVRLKTYLRHSSYIKRFFKSGHLRMAYTFQNIYVGQSPFSSPALFSMIPAAELSEGSYFPVGGMNSIVTRLMEKAEANGVRFHFNKPVSAISVNGRRVTGVQFADGTSADAEIIIANADLPYVYRNLLPKRFKTWRIRKMKYSCSALAFHWGVDKQYPQLGQHSVFLSDDYKQGLRKIFRDKSMNDRPSFYVHAPARTDVTASPAGCDSLSVVVGVGHVDDGKVQNWNEITDKARKYVLGRLADAGMEDLDKHIRVEFTATPVMWEEAYNISKGAVFGSLGHNIMQMGYFRPHNRDNRYRNLYFTGGSTHPGNGIPMVLLSSRLVTERILKEQNSL